MNGLKSILYKGQEHEVKLIAYAGKATQVIFREDKFYIYINNNVSEEKAQQAVLHQLRHWMIETAGEQIKQRTRELSEEMGLSYNKIRIKDTKSRWGSCSSKGNLNFNFRIIMAPEEALDYIIIHELCHLSQMNHGKEFWKLVEKYMPDFEKQKNWFKENGMKLYII